MPYNIAVVGLGWVATARHIPAILRNRHCRLVGVIDRDAAKAAAVAVEFNLPHHAGSMTLRDVPWFDQVDAVTIAAPPSAHSDLACAALAAGKHVLTEKPFALAVDEGATMLAAAAGTGKTLAVVHNFQFARAMRRMERDIAAGNLGTIKWIAATQLGNPRRRLPSWYRQLPLGLFYDESPHFLYLLRRLAGNLALQDAVAWRANPTSDDNTPDEIRLIYCGAQDVPVTLTCNFVSPLSEWTIMVGGDQALGIVDIFRDFYLRLPQDGAHTLPQILGTSCRATLQHWANYIPNGLAYWRGRLDYGNDEIMRRFTASMESGVPPDGIAATDAQEVLTLQHEAVTKLRWL
jgi:predicted dehydrogenase